MAFMYKQVEAIQEFVDAIRLRVDVFIKEQGCPPGWEPDELDKDAQHFIAKVDGKIVATLRVLDEPKGVYKIERMAVAKSGKFSVWTLTWDDIECAEWDDPSVW